MLAATWNISCGRFEHDCALSLDHAADYIGQSLARAAVDLVALQECPLPRSGSRMSFIDRIKAKSNLEFVEATILSDSHLLPNADMGLAILSRYPLKNPISGLFKIPELMIAKSPDPSAKLHQKGYLVADVVLPVGRIRCVTAHLPPFRWLAEEPDSVCFESMWRDLDDAIAADPAEVVALLDCNLANPLNYLSRCREQRLAQCVHVPTRPTGELHDHVIASPDRFEVLIGVHPTRSDHRLVTALLATRTKGGRATRSVSVRHRATHVLHLSDLHFGPGSTEDVDWKTFVPLATRETRRDRMVQYLRALPTPPDLVVVSGDLTIGGHREGFYEFRETVRQLSSSGFLPDHSRILVVPGNHDVRRIDEGAPASAETRWTYFREFLFDFPHPLLSFDSQARLEILDWLKIQLAGGDDTWGDVANPQASQSKCQLPFVLDRDAGILIYGFNSASISGSRLDIPAVIETLLKRVLQASESTEGDLGLLAGQIDNDRWADPSRVDPVELELMNAVLAMLHDHVYGFDTFTKLAVLHHHVSPVVPEEVTKFEALTNAGRFKSELAAAGFDVILHGHKHWPAIDVELGADRGQSQIIVSGGTIGGGTSAGAEPGFYCLKFPSDRRSMEATFVPLRAVGNPTTAVKSALESTKRFPLKVSHLAFASLSGTRLGPLLARAERSLLAHVRHTSANERSVVGWSHALSDDRISIVATAYGVSCLDLIASRSDAAQEAAAKALATLLDARNDDGGWSASSQSNVSYPEPTAFVIDALASCARIVLTPFIESLEAMAENDDVFWSSTYSVARVAQTLCRRRPQSPLLRRCVEALFAGALRDHEGRIRAWPKCLPSAAERLRTHASEPSLLHTAHARLALSNFSNLGGDLQGLDSVGEWLIGQRWDNTSEDINRRRPDGKYDTLVVKHYTAPWALMATLDCLTLAPSDRLIEEARTILEAHVDGLWDWGGTMRPIWATHDALKALTRYALATF
jgi:predicted phosphodiesterase